MSNPQPSGESPPVSGFDSLMKDSAAQGYWVKRVVAFVIDAIIVDIALAILALVTVLPLFVFSGPEFFFAAVGGVFAVLSGVVLFLYFLFVEMWYGASLGKRVFGLKVVSESGRNPNAGEAALRNVSKIYWLLLLLDIIVGLAMSKKYTQKYSDVFAKTSVVAA